MPTTPSQPPRGRPGSGPGDGRRACRRIPGPPLPDPDAVRLCPIPDSAPPYDDELLPPAAGRTARAGQAASAGQASPPARPPPRLEGGTTPANGSRPASGTSPAISRLHPPAGSRRETAAGQASSRKCSSRRWPDPGHPGR